MQRILAAFALVGLTFAFTGCSKDPEEAAISLLEDMANLVDKHKDDCDKMGGELSSFMDKHADTIKSMKEFADKQTPEQKKASEEKYKERTAKAGEKMMGGVMKCMTNEKVKAAMGKMK